ncbi:MAG: SAM-dependent methyltransferase [Thermodesulfobacteriota bacterium]|nr:SAM-dependent methyltransferase [Thermodesulfobacteriota bacterium]
MHLFNKFRSILVILSAALLLVFAVCPVQAGDKGEFYLVSIGVGDPDLITVRAINTIKKADIIICRENTRQDFAEYLEGKTFWKGAFREWRTYGDDCSRLTDKAEQAECRNDKKVRDALVKKIRAAIADGKTIAVLGYGDLLIYGGPYRWYLVELGDLNPMLIPGVSCLNAANAALGTDIMGGKNTSSAIMTHYMDLDKLGLSQANPTLVVFTMHTAFPDLVKKIREYYPDDTPIAIVFYAGYKNREHIVSGTLTTILKKTEGMDFPFQHLVYVGDFLKNRK